MGVRVALGGAEPRGGTREATRYAFPRAPDRAAVWIAFLAPLVATFVVLIAR